MYTKELPNDETEEDVEIFLVTPKKRYISRKKDSKLLMN